MRIMWRAWGLGVLVAAGLILSNGTMAANDSPVVHVKTVVKDGSVQLEADANAPFEYTTYRPSENLYVLDMTGVSAADAAGARVVASELMKGYRVVTYSAGQKPVVRVEILLAQGVEPKLERNGSQGLTLSVSRDAAANLSATATASAKTAAIVPVSAKASDLKVSRTSYEAIRSVNLAQNGTATEVNISGSGPLTYQSLLLHNPDRLVLDFAGSHLAAAEKHLASNLDPVREIRLSQYTPEVSRVVIDLRQSAPYNITGSGNVVTVSFSPNSTPAGRVNARPKSAPADQPSSVITTKSQPVVSKASYAVEIPTVKPADIPAPAAILPVSLTQPSSVLASPVPVTPQQEAVAATRVASDASAIASNVANTSAVAELSPVVAKAATLEVVPSAQPQAGAPAAGGKFSGEPISVNLKDVDLRDFFRLVHEISALNVVVDPSVKGNLTIVLDDVPWDQALDIVLKNNDLEKQLDGNVLRIATKDTVRREAEESRDLAKAQAEAADVVTTTRVLSYAKATLLATTLKRFLSSRGDIIADDRSNTLIIRDIPVTLPVVDNLIRQLDRKSQQVEIEARVVAANRSFSREIGTELAFAGRSGNSALAGAPGAGAGPTTFTPAPPVVVGTGGSGSSGGAPPNATNLGANVATSGSGFQYLFASPNFALDYIITAAESRGVGKLLSKPKVITQNNAKATVKQGTKIPVQTIVNNTVSVQFVDAVLELDVTPQITAEGTIFMDVTVENDQIDNGIARVQGIPAIDTQSAETKVTVNDGATVVIGGIIITNQQTQVDQVPFLGSVPLLGNLFKHTTVSSISQELLFFLTPRILPS